MPGSIHPMPPVSRASRFTIDRATIQPAAQFLARSIVERRNPVPILSNVLVTVDAAGLVVLRATDLDLEAAFALPAAVDAAGDAFTVDAQAFADVLKAAEKGACVSVSYEPGSGRCAIVHGRARNVLPVLPAGDFPALYPRALEPVTLDAGTLAGDLARLKPFMGKDEPRYYLMGVECVAGPDGLAMTATDGCTLARITRPAPAGVEALAPGILPRKLVDVLAKLAKGATGSATLAIGADRARFTLDGVTVESKLIDGTFPDTSHVFARIAGAQRLAFYDLEPTLSPSIVETFRKALGVAPLVDVGEGVFALTAPDAPEFVGITGAGEAKADRKFTTGHDGAAALAYLTDLANRRGFDLNAFHAAARDSVEDGCPPVALRLVERRGVVLGLTIGHETAPARKAGERTGIYRPATAEEIAETVERNGEGMRALIERDGVEIIADRDTPAQYVDGAVCVIMPREREEAVSALVRFHAPDGMAYPVRTTTQANGVTGAIELSAEAVRRLAGPVDPSTFVDIPALQFHHGKALAPGWMLPKAPKLDAAAALRMTAAEMAAYAEACRPVFVGVPDTAQAAAVEPVAEPVAIVAPEPATVAPVEPVEAPQAATVPADAVLARLEALEAIVARLSRPVVAGKRQRSEAERRVVAGKRQRSEAERRAVLRAWRMRGEARTARAAAVMAESASRETAAALRVLRADHAELQTVARGDHAEANRHYARAARMVRVAVRQRAAGRRLADDLRGAQAEARALSRRLTDQPRARVPFSDPARVLENLERAARDLHHVGTRRAERAIASHEYLMGPGGMAALDNALALLRPAGANSTRDSGAVAALAA